MRKVIFGGATSLDNFLARSDHAVDWLIWNDEVAAVTAAMWQTVDTVVMGRKTYEVAAAFGQPDGYPGVANYVFSRTLTTSPSPRIELVRTDAVGFMGRLKAAPGKDICVMGGGDFAHSLLEADLVDVIGFNIHPLLLGSGIPALHRLSRQINLELKECRRFTTGCVLLSYRVRREAPEGIVPAGGVPNG